MENKREERDGVLIGAHIQNIPYLSIVTTQEKPRVGKASINEGKGWQARRRVRFMLRMSQVREHVK